MRIMVYGAGAIGGTVGGGITKAGEDVVLVDKVKEHVDQMNAHGLKFTGVFGDMTVPVKAILPDQMKGPLELVFLAVKSQDTEVALAALMPHLGPQSVVVSLQNGMNPPLIADRIGAERTVGAYVTIPVDYHGPGLIMRGGEGKIYVGELDGIISDRVKKIRDLLANSCKAFITENVYGYLWSKLVYSSSDTLAAMVDSNTDELFVHDSYKDLAIEVILECIHVAKAEGIKLESLPLLDIQPFIRNAPGDREKMYQAFREFGEKNKGNLKTRSGLWRDLWVRKRKTEIPWLTGYVIKRGKALGISTPICEAMLRIIGELEAGTRSMGWENLDELNELRAKK